MTMKTYEELKAMTTEDLVAYAMKMQEDLENKQKSIDYWINDSNKYSRRCSSLRSALKSLLELSEE